MLKQTEVLKGVWNVELVGGKGLLARDIWFMARCKPGKYVALVSTLWKQSNINIVPGGDNAFNSVSFWIYNRNPVKIVRIIQGPNLMRCRTYLIQGFKNYVSAAKITFSLILSVR